MIYAPVSSAGVMKAWSYTSTSPYAFVVCTGAILPLYLPQHFVLKHLPSVHILISHVILHNTDICINPYPANVENTVSSYQC